MKILMIGNGFDLEHELPTKYTQFLEFVTRFKYAYLSANSVPKRLYDIKDDYLKTIFENPEYEDRVVALHTFTENNVWINYFQKVYKKHLANKENWIDFESEISSMIQTMDGLIKYYEGIAMGDSKNENLEKNYKSKLYNKKHFVISEMAIQSYDEQLLEYEKLIKSEEKIDKESYSAIINSIFYMFIDKYGDIEKLWNILLRISRGPGEEVAKDVLKELIENSDDELERIRYNHLLQEIQMNEYFDMQAEEFEKNYEYEPGE